MFLSSSSSGPIPGPFLVHSKSFPFISIQTQRTWTRSCCYFHFATTNPPTSKLFLGPASPQANQDWLLTMTDCSFSHSHRCPECPNSCQNDTLSSQTTTPDLVVLILSLISLTGKKTFWKYKCSNAPTLFKMTLCPPRLNLQTLWMGGILTGKWGFWGTCA